MAETPPPNNDGFRPKFAAEGLKPTKSRSVPHRVEEALSRRPENTHATPLTEEIVVAPDPDLATIIQRFGTIEAELTSQSSVKKMRKSAVMGQISAALKVNRMEINIIDVGINFFNEAAGNILKAEDAVVTERVDKFRLDKKDPLSFYLSDEAKQYERIQKSIRADGQQVLSVKLFTKQQEFAQLEGKELAEALIRLRTEALDNAAYDLIESGHIPEDSARVYAKLGDARIQRALAQLDTKKAAGDAQA